MITIVILATIALVIVGATIVSATRDGYRRTPARMWDIEPREPGTHRGRPVHLGQPPRLSGSCAALTAR